MDSSIRRLKNVTTTCKKAARDCLKSVRTAKVIGSTRSKRIRDAATVLSSDTTQQAGSSVTNDLPKEIALSLSGNQIGIPVLTEYSHDVFYNDVIMKQIRSEGEWCKMFKSWLVTKAVPLRDESGPAMENAVDTTLNSCSNTEEEQCKSLSGVTVVGKQTKDTGEVSAGHRGIIVTKPRKQRIDQSGDATYAKEQLRVNPPDPVTLYYTRKTVRFDSADSILIFPKEYTSFINPVKTEVVTIKTSKEILDEICMNKKKSDSSRATRKAKRMRFLVNGDRFSKGVVVAVTHERYRSFDSLLTELSDILSENKYLINGVRTLFSIEGCKISQLEELEDGEFYICSSGNNFVKKIDYVALKNVKISRPITKQQSTNNVSSSPSKQLHLDNKPKIIFVVRNGAKPRKIVRILLNKRNSPSLEHVLTLITESVKLDTGAVRKVYMSSGRQIRKLEQFFEPDDLFFAYGSERMSRDDLKLNVEEMKIVESYKRRLRKPTDELKDDTSNIVRRVPRLPEITVANENTTIPLPSKIQNRYTVGDRLGGGHFAIVYRCFDRRTKSDYALKVIKKTKSPQMKQMIINEPSILKTLNHPNIIRLISEQLTATHMYLITELVSGGTLYEAIARSTRFSGQDKRLITKNLASALAYLHGMNIVHRDVKPENLLVEFDRQDHVLHLKLADFGISKKINKPLYTMGGTLMYTAPEILNHKGYGVKIDVWAAGVVLYLLLCSIPPFFNKKGNRNKLTKDIRKGTYSFPEPYWDHVCEEAKDLVRSMLEYNPSLRFSAKDVLNHPWCDDDFW